MSASIDPGEVINAGAFLVSALAARWARKAHRDLRPRAAHDDVAETESVGDLVREVAKGQREMTRLFAAHVASDEVFETEVRRVLRLPKQRHGIHEVRRP